MDMFYLCLQVKFMDVQLIQQMKCLPALSCLTNIESLRRMSVKVKVVYFCFS